MKVDWSFFDVPIYRCPIEMHTALMDKQRKEAQRPASVVLGPDSESFRHATTHFETKLWYPWRYNEIIAFVRLYVCGSQIRGELWRRRGKRMMPLPKAPFAFVGDVFQLDTHPGQSSDEIFLRVRAALAGLTTTKSMQRRHVELTEFDRFGSLFNWQALVLDT